MSSSPDEANLLIEQWRESGILLHLVFSGLGITISEEGARVDDIIGIAPEGLRITAASGSFELRLSLSEWTLSVYEVPGNRRCVKMVFGDTGAVLSLCPVSHVIV